MSQIIKNDELISSSTKYILMLPQGKPDTKFKREGRIDERPRVPQRSQTDYACEFYALNRLRDRIGPNHAPEFKKARENEKICSDFYKKMNEIEKKHKSASLSHDELRLLNEIIQYFTSDTKRSSIKEKLSVILEALSEHLSTLETITDSQKIVITQKLANHCRNFCAQGEIEEFTVFSEDYLIGHPKISSERLELMRVFLKNINFDCEKHYYENKEKEFRLNNAEHLKFMATELADHYVELYKSKEISFKDLLKETPEYLLRFKFIAVATTLDFKKSEWSPSEPRAIA